MEVERKGLSDFDVGKIANAEKRMVITNDSKTFVRENLLQGQVIDEGILVNQLGAVSNEKKAAYIKEFITNHEKELHGKITTLEWSGHRQLTMEETLQKMQKNLSLTEKSETVEKVEKSAIKEIASAEKSTFEKAKDLFRVDAKTLSREAKFIAKPLELAPNPYVKGLGLALDVAGTVADIVDLSQSANGKSDVSKAVAPDTGKTSAKPSKEAEQKGKDYER
jgi:hypothetical protein